MQGSVKAVSKTKFPIKETQLKQSLEYNRKDMLKGVGGWATASVSMLNFFILDKP